MRSKILFFIIVLISIAIVSSYSNEKIISAKYVTRPSSNNVVRSMNLYDHHGIFVGTKSWKLLFIAQYAQRWYRDFQDQFIIETMEC